MSRLSGAPGSSNASADLGAVRRICIVAGEASADLHGAKLVQAMRAHLPGARFWGIGGERMARAGVRLLFTSDDLAVVGLTEVLGKLPVLHKAYRTLTSLFRTARPDLCILIDYPGFNLRLARSAKKAGVPVMYYIGPQLWAWRPQRARIIRACVDRLAVILPFEETFYRRYGIRATYVGHPLMDAFLEWEARRVGISAEARPPFPRVGLVPGSRRDEVRRLLPVMVAAVGRLRARFPGIHCVLPVAPTLTPAFMEPFVRGSKVAIELDTRELFDVLEHCDAALVTSGTATLETALLGTPMAIVYKVSPLTYWAAKRVVKVPHIGLVNLVAGEAVVPELIQNEATPEHVARTANLLFEDLAARRTMQDGLRRVGARLGAGGASARAAEMAVEMLTARR